MKSRKPIALFPLALLLAAAPAAAQGEPSAAEVNYDVLAPELLAVELTGPEVEVDLGEVVRRHGRTLRDAQAFGPRTFRLLELSGPLTDPGARAALAADLLARPEVEYVTPVWRDEAGFPEFPSRRMIVRFEASVAEELQRAMLDAHPWLLAPERPWQILPETWMGDTTAATGEAMLANAAALGALPGVRWAQPDRVAGAILDDLIPNDPSWSQCWGLHNTGQTTGPLPPSNSSWTGTADADMDLPEAWDITTGSPLVRVVVFDGGIDLSHPDLPVALGADFTGQNQGGGPVNAGACHGTAVGGCIAASINNATGVVGVAPGCGLASAAVMIPQNIFACTNSVSIQTSWLMGGLNWTLLIGARVTNSSFGMGFDQGVADAYDATRDIGVVHFASSGNKAPNPIGFPANDDDVVAVGNLRPDGVIAGSSQTGSVLDLCAPGTNVYTTDWSASIFGYVSNGSYAMVNGTSFASPYTAGVAALVLSQNFALTPSEVTLILKKSAVDLGSFAEDPTYGAGLVNAHRALLLANEFANGSLRVYNGPGLTPWFATVALGVTAAGPNELVLVHEGTYAEALTITKPLKLMQWTAYEGSNGPAVVGE